MTGKLTVFATAFLLATTTAAAVVNPNASFNESQPHILDAETSANPPQQTHRIATGRIVVTQQEAACHRNGSDSRVTQQHVNRTGNGYSIGIEGYIASATPCVDIVSRVKQRGESRYVIVLETVAQDTVCIDCVGQARFHIGANVNQSTVIAVQHGNTTVTTISTDASHKGNTALWQRLWRFLTHLF